MWQDLPGKTKYTRLFYGMKILESKTGKVQSLQAKSAFYKSDSSQLLERFNEYFNVLFKRKFSVFRQEVKIYLNLLILRDMS